MKTKHLLFCAAIGAAFTACTADEDLMLQNNDVLDAKMAIRPVLGTDITIGGGVDSRLALGTGVRPVFESVDALGAAVIDIPKYDNLAGYQAFVNANNVQGAYELKEWYFCNNAFTTANGGNSWTAEQAMVEGNYLFYAPYNEGLALRSRMTVAVPRVQDASTDKKALEDYYADVNNVAMVGYKFITGTEKSRPSVSLYNIFAYPEFVIKNDFDGYLFNKTTADAEPVKAWNGAVKLDSIQFVNVNAARAGKDMVVGGLLSNANVKAKLSATGDWANVKKLLAAKSIDLLDATNQIKSGRHDKGDNAMKGVITTAIVGRTIEQGQSIKVACVMPAYSYNYTNDQLLAKLYFTIDGKNYVMYDNAAFSKLDETQTKTKLNAGLTAQNLGYAMDAKGEPGLTSLSFVAGQRVPAEAIYIDNGNYQLKPESGRTLFNIELTGGKASTEGVKTVQIMNQVSVDAVDATGVTTTAQLISLINQAANGTKWEEDGDATTSSFDIEDINTVEINSALIDALSYNNDNAGGSLTIKTVVPIANDVTVVGVDGQKVTFKSVTGNEYDITLSGMVTEPTLARREYVNLSSTAGLTVINLLNDVVIWTGEDEGTISLNNQKNHLAITSLHTAKIMSGSVNTVKGLTLDLSDKKFIASNINNASTLSISGSNNQSYITNFENEGELNFAATVLNTSKTTLINNGVINLNNNSTFNVNGGTGTFVLAEAAAQSIITIANPATQNVKYVTTGTVTMNSIEKASDFGYVDEFVATGVLTMSDDYIEAFGDIKNIVTMANVSFKEGVDLTGFTIKLGANQTWSSTATASTTVNGVNVILNGKTLTLSASTYNFLVNGTRVGAGKITADGYFAKWNGTSGATYAY